MILMPPRSYGGVYEIYGAILGGFLLFYFPVTWIYRFDFIGYLRALLGSGAEQAE